MKDIGTQVKGSVLSFADFNDFALEVQTVITTTGVSLAAALDQFAKSLAQYAAVANFYTGSINGGDQNKQILTSIAGYAPLISYEKGMIFYWRPSNANTGGTTVDVDGVNPIAINRESNGAALSANDLVTTKDAKTRYDGAVFLLLGV